MLAGRRRDVATELLGVGVGRMDCLTVRRFPHGEGSGELGVVHHLRAQFSIRSPNDVYRAASRAEGLAQWGVPMGD